MFLWTLFVLTWNLFVRLVTEKISLDVKSFSYSSVLKKKDPNFFNFEICHLLNLFKSCSVMTGWWIQMIEISIIAPAAVWCLGRSNIEY